MGNIIKKDITIDGVGPWFWDSKDVDGWIAILTDWNNELKNSILSYVENKGTVVQAGGMLGMYPRLLSEIFQNVITFEPNKYNYSILRLNCFKNNIKHYNSGLSDTIKKSEMISLSETNLGMKLIPNEYIPKTGFENTIEEIDLITIDSLELENCDLILLDIERHELYALNGAVSTINKFKPVIIMEHNIEDVQNISKFMEQIEYVAVHKLKNDIVYMHKDKIKKENKINKRILIALPSAKDVEPETMKSINRLIIPQGYEVYTELFYGYAIDQVRNLIANFAIQNNFDYLFCVDSDMVLQPDTLAKLLSVDKDIVGGAYKQRNLQVDIPEVYFSTLDGGSRNAVVEELRYAPDLFPVDSLGFGCILIKKIVLTTMEYPHFYYKHSIDFKDTVSEDTFFCRKARAYGFETYCLKTVTPGHIMKTTIWLDTSTPKYELNN